MNNITIGKYVRGNSYLYKLDPRLKIVSTIILMVAAFLIPARNVNSLYVLLGFLGVLLLIIITSRINIIHILKGLTPVLFITLFTFIMQLIYSKEDVLITSFDMHISAITILIFVALLALYMFTKKFISLRFLYLVIILGLALFLFVKIDLFSFTKWTLDIYKDGLINGAFFAIRIIIIVIISTLLTISTSNSDINLGFEWLLHPLTYIKIPVSVLSTMLALTLRFIPTLLMETNKIMKAQASRGIDYNEGNFGQKVKQIVTLLVPIFAISLTKAEDLSNAMEARGYVVGAKRTSIEELKFKFIDLLAFIFILGLLAATIYVRVVI